MLILDPACGTGTFLREVISVIRSTIRRKGMKGAWNTYVVDHLLDRLFGFELLMAPYTICHLKLALEIGGADTGFRIPEDKRLNVFLTNTLEKAHQEKIDSLFAPEIAREAMGADAVKREKPVMVILGNPPYSGHSSNKGEWIRGLLRGRDGELGTDNYFMVDGEGLGESNPKWLNDDYVKFIRFAQWRIARTGEGVLGYVTNHSYLDNPTFRGMRQSLMSTFNEIYLLDMHGNTKKREATPDGSRDENVFDIQQGVAVGLFVKHKNDSSQARVFHADLWGDRDTECGGGKYGWLDKNDVETTKWSELSPKSPLYLFVPLDDKLSEEYNEGKKLTDVFSVSSVGIVTARDKLAIQWTVEDMEHVVSNFLELSVEEVRSLYNLGEDTRDWKVELAQQDLRTPSDLKAHITQILYRPFDTRYTCYTGKSRGFICMPRPGVMHHMRAGPNLGLIAVRQVAEGTFNHVYLTKHITDFRTTLSNKGGAYLFPLYTYAKEKRGKFGETYQVNLDRELVENLGSSLNLEFIPERPSGDLESVFGPEDVFHYIYAILHSPEYRSRYTDFLKYDFPNIPFTSNRMLFATLVKLGRQLASFHLMEVGVENIVTFPRLGDNSVQNVRYLPPGNGEEGRVQINHKQYFERITPDIWKFAIGGYRPAEKWLKDRKGRSLSFEDIEHYGRICAVLRETPILMSKIDKAINEHGGWPLS